MLEIEILLGVSPSVRFCSDIYIYDLSVVVYLLLYVMLGKKGMDISKHISVCMFGHALYIYAWPALCRACYGVFISYIMLAWWLLNRLLISSRKPALVVTNFRYIYTRLIIR